MERFLYQSNPNIINMMRVKHKENPSSISKYIRYQLPSNIIIRHYEDKELLIISKEVLTLRATHTNKLFQTNKKEWQIFLNRKKKTAFIKNNGLRQLNKDSIPINKKEILEIITKFMGDKFEWINSFPIEHSIGFIWKRGYSSPYKYYRDNDILWSKRCNVIQLVYIHDKKEVKRVSKNWDFLKQNPEIWYTIPNIEDIVRFAKILQEKINWNWSTNRFKEQHDKWSKEISNLDLIFDPELSIDPLFKELDIPDLVLLKTNSELKDEGKRQKHCVYTYKSNIDRGELAIFVYKKQWTCAINRQLKLVQMKGIQNKMPPTHIKDELTIYLDIIGTNKKRETDKCWFQLEPAY